jgi:hypothetical protein
MFRFISRTKRVRFVESKRALRNFLKQAILEVGQFDTCAVKWIAQSLVRYTKPEDFGLFADGGLCISAGAFRCLEEEIVQDVLDTVSNQHEFKLNNAGLKLYVFLNVDGRIQAYIGGDQVDFYTGVYPVLTVLLMENGLLPENKMDRQPLGDGWIIDNWEKIPDWAVNFLLSRPDIAEMVEVD